MSATAAFTSLGISLSLGLLVGLQRQRSEDRLGGIRTFALVALLGSIAAILASHRGDDDSFTLRPDLVWLPTAGLLAVAMVLVARSRAGLAARDGAPADHRTDPTAESGQPSSPGGPARDIGLTTELAMLTMYLVGVVVVVGPRAVAVALGAGVAVLLQAKFVLHRFAARLGEKDLTAIFRFALISLVILPVLPSQAYGPYGVFNPHQTWLMVVLIVGISLAGYVAYRLAGERTGPILTGVLGGLVSSTATTASFARRSATMNHAGGALPVHAPVLIVLIAGTVMCGRVLIELAVVARDRFGELAPPIAIVLGASAAACVVAWARARRSRTPVPPQENPTELKAPIAFAIIYTLVQFAAAAGKDWLGHSGLYAVAAVSGLTDMDAITLSVGRMASSGATEPAVAWRAVVVAIIANIVFKCGVVAVLGSRPMRRLMLIYSATTIAACAVVLAVW